MCIHTVLILDAFLIIFDNREKYIVFYVYTIFFRYTMEKNEKEEQGNPMKEFNSRYIYNLYVYLEIYTLVNIKLKFLNFRIIRQ